MNTVLHHFAYNIASGKLEIVVELLEKMGCSVAYRVDGARWCQMEQKPIPIDIQIIEVNDNPVDINKKVNTHIAFLSDSPVEDIRKIEDWARSSGVEFRKGGWSEKELWFDLPEVFVNFVIEVMHTSIIE